MQDTWYMTPPKGLETHRLRTIALDSPSCVLGMSLQGLLRSEPHLLNFGFTLECYRLDSEHPFILRLH